MSDITILGTYFGVSKCLAINNVFLQFDFNRTGFAGFESRYREKLTAWKKNVNNKKIIKKFCSRKISTPAWA